MSKKPTAAVAQALAVVEGAKRRLEEAMAAEDRAKKELHEAQMALYVAKVAADAALPRCRIASLRTNSSAEACIVRKTPGGMLVVRKPGEDAEEQYKWNKYFGGRFEQAKRYDKWATPLVLTDVPAEFMPQGVEA